MTLSREVLEAATAHARAQFPKESCGLVVAGTYFPCKNIAANPLEDFAVDPVDRLKAERHGPIEAVLHSHPHGPLFPTAADMTGQMDMGVPWGIIALDEERAGLGCMWGDTLPIAPLVGRQFMHGVHDCYSVIRDAFRLGKEELARQDIEWPFDPIELPNLARDDNWWANGDDLYVDHFAKFGFREISMSEARPGDCFMARVRSPKINHAGLLIGGYQLIQHFPGYLSRREPSGIWARAADMWVRYEGPADA